MDDATAATKCQAIALICMCIHINNWKLSEETYLVRSYPLRETKMFTTSVVTTCPAAAEMLRKK